jgi:hypothetical protein
VKVLDLYLTATDLHGRFWQRSDYLGHKILGRQHTKYFQLKYRQCKVELEPEERWLGYDATQNDFNDASPDQDAGKVSHLSKLARPTRRFGNWDDIRTYLLEDHRVGQENAASLHPAVLANTAVDVAENARAVLGSIAGQSKLKLPRPVLQAGEWLGALFGRLRLAVKLFLPRQAAADDDRRPPWYVWVPAAVAAFSLGLGITLLRQLFLLMTIRAWLLFGAVGLGLLLLLVLVRMLFPRKLAGIARLLPFAGLRTLCVTLLLGLVGESPTLAAWTHGVKLWGVGLSSLLTGVRSFILPALFGFAAYDVLLAIARGMTRAVKALPAPEAVHIHEQIRVEVPGQPGLHPPEGILFDHGRLVVTTTDGYVLRHEGPGWRQLGHKLPKGALGIAADPLGGYLLAGSGQVWRWTEGAAAWTVLGKVPSANFLVALKNGEILVSGERSGAVWRLRRDPAAPSAPVPAERFGRFFTPNGMAVGPTGKTLYVAEMVSGKVLAVALADPARRRVVARLGFGALADGVAVLPDGNLAVSTNWGHVCLIDPQRGAVLRRLRFPAHLAPANLAVRDGDIWFAGLGCWIDLERRTLWPRGEYVGSFVFPPGP